jgi:hypothetical protein
MATGIGEVTVVVAGTAEVQPPGQAWVDHARVLAVVRNQLRSRSTNVIGIEPV